MTLNIFDTVVGENDATARFLVTLSAPSEQTVSVVYDDLEGSASDILSADYTRFNPRSLSFAPGETEKEISVSVTQDSRQEGDEAFSIVLYDAEGATIGRPEGVAKILDDDGPVPDTVSLTAIATDVSESAGFASFVLRLDGTSTAPVTLQYSTVSGTAIAGLDFTAGSGSVVFGPGDMTKTVRIAVTNDTSSEEFEDFSLLLTNVMGAIAGSSVVKAVIADDDGPPVDRPVIDISDATIQENFGSATLRVTLSAPSEQTVTVVYDDLEGSASDILSADYTRFNPRSLSFAPGETRKDISVILTPDSREEGDESFSVNLYQPVNAIIGDGSGEITILDDDSVASGNAQIFASINETTSPRITEGRQGRTVDVTVALSRPAEDLISIPLAVDSSSTLGADEYLLSADRLVFAPGVLAQTLRIFVDDDDDTELTETLRINFDLSEESSLFNVPLSAELTVVDDEIRLSGTDGADRFTGTPLDEVYDGLDGDDWIEGNGGNDLLFGGQGNDLIFGDGSAAIYFGMSPANQVYRLYQATLDRAPDIGGHANWAGRIASGERTLIEVADGFVRSPQFKAIYSDDLSNEGFVTLLYNNVLDRAPDAKGLARWIGELEDGSSRAEVVLGFSQSPQFVTDTTAAANVFAAGSAAASWSDEVYRLFQATLDRAPDVQGFERWTGELASGKSTLIEVADGFVRSPQFKATYDNLSDTAFVTLLFNNVLDRAPDAQGLARWTGDLADGASRAQVVLGFSQSPQFAANTAADVKGWMRNLGTHDWIDAGSGTNLVAGGQFADVFVFNAAQDGRTTVADLEAWDFIDLNGFGYGTVAEARAEMSQVGNTVVFADQGVEVTLRGVALADITDDVILV